jgi:hypothetical protein
MTGRTATLALLPLLPEGWLEPFLLPVAFPAFPAKGVVSGVGKVKVKEGYKVNGVEVGEVNDEVDKAKM